MVNHPNRNRRAAAARKATAETGAVSVPVDLGLWTELSARLGGKMALLMAAAVLPEHLPMPDRLVATVFQVLAKDASQAAPHVDAWMPITTAPKCGSFVDLWARDGGRAANAVWVQDLLKHGGRMTGWRLRDGSIEADSSFTHWRRQPLPPLLQETK